MNFTIGEELIGLGVLAKRAGIQPGTLRHHLLSGNVPEPALRGPTGARLFNEQEAQAVLLALPQCQKRRGSQDSDRMQGGSA